MSHLRGEEEKKEQHESALRINFNLFSLLKSLIFNWKTVYVTSEALSLYVAFSGVLCIWPDPLLSGSLVQALLS